MIRRLLLAGAVLGTVVGRGVVRINQGRVLRLAADLRPGYQGIRLAARF